MATDVDAEMRSLYAGAPDRFVEERNALAERLKAEGDAAAAKRVAGLKRPTVAAWAVDQLASADPEKLDQLLDAGRELATAQRQVATAGGAERMQEIASVRRRLVDDLVGTAERALSDSGMPPARATLDKVANTLTAIATDDDAADQVRAGILPKELPAPSGFGDDRLDSALLASVTELPARPGAERTELSAAELRARERRQRLASEAGRLAKEAEELEREAADMKRAADAKQRQAEAARKKADGARRKADEAGGA
jgi:hypothetical protein